MAQKLVFDAGHGGHDSGAVGNGLREKDLTLTIVKKMRDILNSEYSGVEVLLTRSTDKFLTLSERAKFSNDNKADFFCSVHINAHNDASANGFETFIYNGTVSSATIANQNVIHPAINKRAGLRDRGKKRANFAVVRETNAPAILTECGFISNKSDAEKLKSDKYLTELARGHVEGIVQALGGITRKTPSKTEQPSGKLYRIQVGAFSSKDNADEYLKTVQKHFPDAFISE